jgi:hypothetical protein
MMGNTWPDPVIGMCNIYKKEINADPEPPATIIITALRQSFFPDAGKISYGCSLWKSCMNEGCSYRRMGMPNRDE